MKILNGYNKNFDKVLDKLLSQRRNKVKYDFTRVTNIIRDVKKNGDKAVLKFEKRFSKNNTIIPSKKKNI